MGCYLKQDSRARLARSWCRDTLVSTRLEPQCGAAIVGTPCCIVTLSAFGMQVHIYTPLQTGSVLTNIKITEPFIIHLWVLKSSISRIASTRLEWRLEKLQKQSSPKSHNVRYMFAFIVRDDDIRVSWHCLLVILLCFYSKHCRSVG